MLTCGPSVFLDVRLDSHAVQPGSTGRCRGILNADSCTQSIDLGVKHEPTLLLYIVAFVFGWSPGDGASGAPTVASPSTVSA